jgi:hypothetical protein
MRLLLTDFVAERGKASVDVTVDVIEDILLQFVITWCNIAKNTYCLACN